MIGPLLSGRVGGAGGGGGGFATEIPIGLVTPPTVSRTRGIGNDSLRSAALHMLAGALLPGLFLAFLPTILSALVAAAGG